MSRLHKNISYDIKAGFGRNLANYVIGAVILALLVGMIVSEMKEIHPDRRLSCFDIISRFFLGVDGNDIASGSGRLEIPFEWLTLHTYIILGIARYPRQDFDECGYNVWIRTKNRNIWWSSKAIWCLLHIILLYVIGLAVVTAAVMLSGGDWSMSITNPYHLNYDMSHGIKIYIILFMMPVVVEFAISAVSMAVSFAVNSVLGFLTGFAMLLCSVFWDNFFCLGRYMMLYSYFPKMTDCVFHLKAGILLCFAVSVCGLIIGYVFYKRKEG